MSGEKFLIYFVLLTCGGAYTSVLFWLGWYLFNRKLARQENDRVIARMQYQMTLNREAQRQPPTWAQGVQG